MNTFTLPFTFEGNTFNAKVEEQTSSDITGIIYSICPSDESIRERFGEGPHEVEYSGRGKNMTCKWLPGDENTNEFNKFMASLMYAIQNHTGVMN